MTRPHVRGLLAFTVRNGPLMLFAGVLIGLVAPTLAEAARPPLGLAVFVLTLGAFLEVDLASFRKELGRLAWTGCVPAWTTFGVPPVMLGLVRLTQPKVGLAQGTVLRMQPLIGPHMRPEFTTYPEQETTMHISPRPIRPFEDEPAPDHRGRFAVMASILYALLAMAGTILLARYLSGYTETITWCGEILVACGLP